MNDPILDLKTNKPISPEKLSFEQMKILFQKLDLIDNTEFKWLTEVQQYRNGIHFFKNREIGNKQNFNLSVQNYLCFLYKLDSFHPYPS